MNSEKVQETLNVHAKRSKDWSEFAAIASKNLREVESAMDAAKTKCETIEGTVQNVRELSKHAQARSYLQICKLAYVDALIRHTGEYNVQLNPEYQCTLTADQTVDFLQEKLTEERSVLNDYATQKEQLERRLGLLSCEEGDDIPDTTDMPGEIRSDRGVAFKQGRFYEIIESEPDVSYSTPKPRTSRVTSRQAGDEH